jgi:hypothetical protein
MARTRMKTDRIAESGREVAKRIAPVRRQRKSLRQHFREGLEAGLRAEPESFRSTRPRTMLSLMVRELVCAAASSRCDAIRLVFTFVDEAELLRSEAQTDEADDNSQGNSDAELADDTKWEWNEGSWDPSEQEKDSKESDAERAARTEALRQELREKFIRAAEAVRENQEREARLAAEAANRTAPNPGPVQFSGNLDASTPITRIGGRIVEG